MKKQFFGFLVGTLVTSIICGLSITALAATGTVSFNISNLQLNGQQISAKGENYTLANGQQVPASITYTDDIGGGTTYLPVRRIAELLGVETGWDNATGSVTVGKTAPAPDTTATTTNYAFNYSYEEFLGLWDISEQNETVWFIAPDSRARAWWTSVEPSLREAYLLQSSSEKLEEFGLAANLMCKFRDVDKEDFASVIWGEVKYKS